MQKKAQEPLEFGPCPACESTVAQVLCESADRLYRTTNKLFRVVECGECRLLRLDPCPPPAELGRYYPDNYWFAPGHDTAWRLAESYRRLVLRDHVRFVRRALAATAGEGLVLDVGCGGGLFLSLLRKPELRVAGLDFSCDAAAVAWREKNVPVVCASLSRAPFAPGSCSMVTMFHVLEHLYEPGAYLEAAHRLLQPDGRLVVQVPNAACWQFFLLGENWTGLDVPRHLFDFRARDLEPLLDASGFEVVRMKHFSLRDNPAGFATSLAPGLDPMVRRIRRIRETPRVALIKNLAYLALVAACLPFALMEAACHAGSTVMVEARKKPS
ncbi:MAG: class I SAM-dependent methyltransferase [Acidobacteria bacterium]|nr:class I SAM-dependent methyltransferase [Acidobacteriota bacterium]